LTDSKGRGDDGGLALVVRRAQGFAVSDALQVGDDPPRPAELLGQSLERIMRSDQDDGVDSVNAVSIASISALTLSTAAMIAGFT